MIVLVLLALLLLLFFISRHWFRIPSMAFEMWQCHVSVNIFVFSSYLCLNRKLPNSHRNGNRFTLFVLWLWNRCDSEAVMIFRSTENERKNTIFKYIQHNWNSRTNQMNSFAPWHRMVDYYSSFALFIRMLAVEWKLWGNAIVILIRRKCITILIGIHLPSNCFDLFSSLYLRWEHRDPCQGTQWEREMRPSVHIWVATSIGK